MNLTHWTYFLSIEQDVKNLSRYIELTSANFGCFSIENARLLMASTQDIDVLLKQVCTKLGNTSSNEAGYRAFLPTQYPNMLTTKVEIPMYDLEFTPYEDWSSNLTPVWWTANNKVKHHRHTHFADASIENLLKSVAGLFIANLYFYSEVEGDIGIYPGPNFFNAHTLTESISPTSHGMVPNYKLP